MQWQTSEVKANAPATNADFEKAEVDLDFKFPDDFKALYQIVNGFKDLDWQEHMFTFWPLEVIIQEFEDSSDKNFIGFCDFLLNSYSIGFVRNRPGVFKSYDYVENEECVAKTFQEIVGMINSSNDNIY